MADQGGTNPWERALHLSGDLEDLNGTELSLGRASTSHLDYHGGSFMSILLEEPSPPITPAKLPTNPEHGQNVAGSASTTVHDPFPIEPYSSSQMGNVSTTTPSLDLVLGEFPTKNVNTVGESDVHPHLTKTTTEPPCLRQPAEFIYMDYENGNNKNITCYGFGHCGDSSSSDQHMTAGGSVANYEQASSVQPTPLQGFSTVNDRADQMSQTVNLTDNLQQNAHQSSLLVYQHFQSLRNLFDELCESIDRNIQAQTAYIRNHPVVLEDDDDDDEDFNTVSEDETEYEEDEDDDDEAVDQNRNEETTGYGNVNSENNIVGMQEGGNVNDDDVDDDDDDDDLINDLINDYIVGLQEGDDGLAVEEIFAALTIDYYEAHPSLDIDPLCCPICLEDFKQWDLLGVLDCNHEFHYQCIGEWLVSKNLCPLCRNVGVAV